VKEKRKGQESRESGKFCPGKKKKGERKGRKKKRMKDEDVHSYNFKGERMKRRAIPTLGKRETGEKGRKESEVQDVLSTCGRKKGGGEKKRRDESFHIVDTREERGKRRRQTE